MLFFYTSFALIAWFVPEYPSRSLSFSYVCAFIFMFPYKLYWCNSWGIKSHGIYSPKEVIIWNLIFALMLDVLKIRSLCANLWLLFQRAWHFSTFLIIKWFQLCRPKRKSNLWEPQIDTGPWGRSSSIRYTLYLPIFTVL